MECTIRAIYIWDVRFPDCPVFELDSKGQRFHMVGDPSFAYDKAEVYNDDDWILFKVKDENVIRIEKTE